ncbi:hypothetical protein MNB_SUP05-SYMBIONT-5-218 [hydrothermal vent metagenome]|uniref:Uncharacterized protein n=1 Tax=hydrothermal vent metagenome TaxID=652676 RepID=A0A1W1E2Y7_9ZZZZ
MIIAAGMYKFNYLANLEGYDVDGNKITIHHTWDEDKNSINDCESDGSCDHMIDYSKPRYMTLGRP